MLTVVGILFATNGNNLINDAATTRTTTIAGVTATCADWNREAAILESTWSRYETALHKVYDLSNKPSSALPELRIVELLGAASNVEVAVRTAPGEPPEATVALTPLRKAATTLVHAYELSADYLGGGPDALRSQADASLDLFQTTAAAGERSLKARARLLHAACPAPIS
jgi:hypothetical protein